MCMEKLNPLVCCIIIVRIKSKTDSLHIVIRVVLPPTLF